ERGRDHWHAQALGQAAQFLPRSGPESAGTRQQKRAFRLPQHRGSAHHIPGGWDGSLPRHARPGGGVYRSGQHVLRPAEVGGGGAGPAGRSRTGAEPPAAAGGISSARVTRPRQPVTGARNRSWSRPWNILAGSWFRIRESFWPVISRTGTQSVNDSTRPPAAF